MPPAWERRGRGEDTLLSAILRYQAEGAAHQAAG